MDGSNHPVLDRWNFIRGSLRSQTTKMDGFVVCFDEQTAVQEIILTSTAKVFESYWCWLCSPKSSWKNLRKLLGGQVIGLQSYTTGMSLAHHEERCSWACSKVQIMSDICQHITSIGQSFDIDHYTVVICAMENWCTRSLPSDVWLEKIFSGCSRLLHQIDGRRIPGTDHWGQDGRFHLEVNHMHIRITTYHHYRQ